MDNTRQLALRVPAEMRAWLEEQAGSNRSSINSEVIRAVRAAMEREPLST